MSNPIDIAEQKIDRILRDLELEIHRTVESIEILETSRNTIQVSIIALPSRSPGARWSISETKP